MPAHPYPVDGQVKGFQERWNCCERHCPCGGSAHWSPWRCRSQAVVVVVVVDDDVLSGAGCEVRSETCACAWAAASSPVYEGSRAGRKKKHTQIKCLQ